MPRIGTQGTWVVLKIRVPFWGFLKRDLLRVSFKDTFQGSKMGSSLN